MKRLDILLYRYVPVHAKHILRRVLAALDAMAPSLVYRPALQRVRTPVAPRVSDSRRRRDILLPWI